MASNSISSNGNFTLTLSGFPVVKAPMSLNLTMSGSNAAFNSQNIAIGSWQGLDTSSLADVRYSYFSNEANGVIKVATDNAGSKIVAILLPGDFAVVPWSGSTSFFAQAYVSASLLQQLIIES